eukprot:scaffold11757_cov100-Phaeocystis_antarctica.AAC.1
MADVPARFTISRASDHDAKQESAVSATPAGPRGRTAAEVRAPTGSFGGKPGGGGCWPKLLRKPTMADT